MQLVFFTYVLNLIIYRGKLIDRIRFFYYILDKTLMRGALLCIGLRL